jgi:plasmid stabilization system protein ParE
MRLVLSRLALAELDEILHFVAERSPLGAAHVEARLRRAFDLIARHPEAAQRLEQRPDVRRLPLARFPYVIYYEVAQDQVTVLRILHGAREQPWDEAR